MPLQVELRNVSKTYASNISRQGVVALSPFDLAVNDGEFLVVVGPSGCGKTTLLRLIAGLERPTSGEVWIKGRNAERLSPCERNVAMVFQSGALYPHMTARNNMAFGLKGMPAVEKRARIDEAAGMLGIERLLDRRPAELSGGERQRVALGRAIVRRPDVYLLDEPLSSLDGPLRRELRGELSRLRHAIGATETGATVIYVTHDQAEARRLGDRLVVMNAGKTEQIGPASEVFERPANEWVAAFLEDEFQESRGALENCHTA